MKKIIFFLIGFAAYAVYFSWVSSLFEDGAPIWSLTGRELGLFAVKIFLYYVGIAYLAYRWVKEKKIRQAMNLPIPLKALRQFSVPGFRLPFHCADPRCGGVIVRTVINDPHSLAGSDKTVYFRTASNRARITLGFLARYRQIFGRRERLFCLGCGTEYINPIVPEKDPLNLYDILISLRKESAN